MHDPEDLNVVKCDFVGGPKDGAYYAIRFNIEGLDTLEQMFDRVKKLELDGYVYTITEFNKEHRILLLHG